MLVILANRGDETAAWLASRWQSHGAVLLTAADLSASGWRYCLPPSGKSRAVVAGREVMTGEITCVLTRMSAVYEQELGHIVPTDRSYVASEMTAFLLAWLSSLTCPVLNRPTPNCLSGPNWRSERWVRLASRLGIAVTPVRRTVSHSSNGPASQSNCEVLVAGDQCFGNAAPELNEQSRLLAKVAGADLLAVQFTGPESGSEFVSASLRPDLASPEVADAVLRYLLGRSAC